MGRPAEGLGKRGVAAKIGSRERVLRAAWVLSLGSPLTAAYAAYVGTSEVLVADLVRSISESIALLLSWLAYRMVQRSPDRNDGAYVRSTYGRVGVLIALVMWTSAMLIIVGVVAGLRNPQAVANVWAGMLVAAGGAAHNIWFWRRYVLISRQDTTAFFGSQWRFYRAKAVVNLSVLVSLTASTLLAGRGWSPYVDTAGSVAVAVFMIVFGFGSLRQALAGMR